MPSTLIIESLPEALQILQTKPAYLRFQLLMISKEQKVRPSGPTLETQSSKNNA